MYEIDRHVKRMLASLQEAERLLANCPPDFHREEYRKAWSQMGDCTEASQEAFEELGPVRSLSICLEFMGDFLPQFLLLNPNDRSYSKALEHAKQYVWTPQGKLRELASHKPAGNRGGNGRYLGQDAGPLRSTSHCYPLPEYKTPGSYRFLRAIWALMWCIQDIHETGGTPFGGIQPYANGAVEIGWSWYCVRGTHASCVGDTTWAWVEVMWDELHRSHPDLVEGAMLLYPPVTKNWIGKWRYVAELMQKEAQK